MARTPRLDIGENYYHIINRANARLQIFNNKEDYELFEDVLQDVWVIEEPTNYLDILTQPMSPKEIERLEQSENKSTPYGDEIYVIDTIEQYGLKATARNSGRPKTIL